MDARPAREMNRPAHFYGPLPAEEAPGISLVRTMAPKIPVTRESRRCPECGEKCWLLDGAAEAVCTCGAVVKK